LKRASDGVVILTLDREMSWVRLKRLKRLFRKLAWTKKPETAINGMFVAHIKSPRRWQEKNRENLTFLENLTQPARKEVSGTKNTSPLVKARWQTSGF
jgi:hypothetical protein